MDLQRNPLMSSVPCGRVSDAPFRVSIFVACVALVLVFGSEPRAVERTIVRKKVINPVESIETNVGAPIATAPVDIASGPISSAPISAVPLTTVPPTAEPQSTEPPSTEPQAAAGGPAPPFAAAVDNTPILKPARTAIERSVTILPVPNAYLFGFVLAMFFVGSCFLHAYAETVIAGRLGVSTKATVLMPFGGHAILDLPSPSVSMVTSAVGPVVHLGICLLCFPVVIIEGQMENFSPFILPAVSFEEHGFASAGLLLFSINWKLFLVNLIPISPLDGANFIRSWKAADSGVESNSASWNWAQFGLLVSMLFFGFSLLSSGPWVPVLAGFLLAWSCVEFLLLSMREYDDESVLGYDFSEGYTSLERDESDAELPAAPPRERALGPIARWKAKRAAKKRQREREQREWAAQELDRLLDKVGKVGMDGLTPDEKKTLKQVSVRYKQ